MTVEIRRNDKCPCGSGLKYKKCCMTKKDVTQHNMPKYREIMRPDGRSSYQVFWLDNVEKTNPIELYKNAEIYKRAILYRNVIEIKDPVLAQNLTDDFYTRYAMREVENEGYCEKIERVGVHENFLKLLETTRKKDQITLLKGMSITPEQLMSLIFKSYKDYNYLYSIYRFENLSKDLYDKKTPKFAAMLNDGTIETIGDTDLTNGQVKKMITERKVIIAHFFDRGNDWHCLFTTYNSIGGKENHNNGQPHYHYFSSAFGINRDEFIESMRCGDYKSTSVHIDLLEYGNQPVNDSEL